jgi:hypothetical protein
MPRTCDPTPTAATRHLRRLVAIVAFLLAACGGSGSSGFDAAAENRTIDRVLATEQCETIDGLQICTSSSGPAPSPTPTAQIGQTATPSETPFPLPSGTATPTGTFAPATPTATRGPSDTPTPTSIPSTPAVDINAAPTDTCPPASDAECVFALTFVPRDVPAGAGYRVAVRGRNPDTRWTIFPATENSAVIELPAGVIDYQIAVLVFLDAPSFVPEEVERLSTTGADFAFVTPVESRPE